MALVSVCGPYGDGCTPIGADPAAKVWNDDQRLLLLPMLPRKPRITATWHAGPRQRQRLPSGTIGEAWLLRASLPVHKWEPCNGMGIGCVSAAEDDGINGSFSQQSIFHTPNAGDPNNFEPTRWRLSADGHTLCPALTRPLTQLD